MSKTTVYVAALAATIKLPRNLSIAAQRLENCSYALPALTPAIELAVLAGEMVSLLGIDPSAIRELEAEEWAATLPPPEEPLEDEALGRAIVEEQHFAVRVCPDKEQERESPCFCTTNPRPRKGVCPICKGSGVNRDPGGSIHAWTTLGGDAQALDKTVEDDLDGQRHLPSRDESTKGAEYAPWGNHAVKSHATRAQAALFATIMMAIRGANKARLAKLWTRYWVRCFAPSKKGSYLLPYTLHYSVIVAFAKQARILGLPAATKGPGKAYAMAKAMRDDILSRKREKRVLLDEHLAAQAVKAREALKPQAERLLARAASARNTLFL